MLTETRVCVRKAEDADLEWILGELRELSDFVETDIPIFQDSPYTRSGILHLIAHHVVLIAEKEYQQVGFIAGTLTPHLFNPSIKTLTMLFFRVTPEARRTRAAFELVESFISAGLAADWISISLGVKTNLKGNHFVKRGFKKRETAFLKERSSVKCRF